MDASVSRANFLLQALQDRGHVVDGLLHLLVVALVGLRDQFVDLAVGNLRQDAVTLGDGQQDGVEHLVDISDHLGIRTLELLGLAAFGELPVARGLYESGDLAGEAGVFGIVIKDLDDTGNLVLVVVARGGEGTDGDFAALDRVFAV